LLFSIGDCTCIVHRYSVARLFVCVSHLSRWRHGSLSRKSFRGRPHAVTSPFPGYTPHVTAKPKTLSRQKGYNLFRTPCISVKEFCFRIDDLFYVTYKTGLPLDGPVSWVIRTTPPYSPDDRATTATTRYIHKFTQFTLQQISPTKRIVGRHPITRNVEYTSSINFSSVILLCYVTRFNFYVQKDKLCVGDSSSNYQPISNTRRQPMIATVICATTTKQKGLPGNKTVT
jgi:hypothetical protein